MNNPSRLAEEKLERIAKGCHAKFHDKEVDDEQ